MTIDSISFDHVQLLMPPGAEDRARAFYADVLGMTVVPKPAPLSVDGGIWFRSGGAEIHLSGDPGFVAARIAHPALRVDDLDAFAARCQAAGINVAWDDRYPGIRRFYVSDPFGNSIELMQPQSERT